MQPARGAVCESERRLQSDLCTRSEAIPGEEEGKGEGKDNATARVFEKLVFSHGDAA